MSSLPLGTITDLTGFSPADFGDAEDLRPMAVQLDPTGLGSMTPYSTLVNNVFQRQATEIKDKTVNPSPSPLSWRKRLKEFMTNKNEDLVAALKRPLDPESSIYKAEIFLNKFGKPDFQPTHHSLQTTFLDASGSSYIERIEKNIKEIGPSSPKQIIEQVRWLYDMYKQAGEECLKQELILKTKLDVLDKTYQKIIGFCDLPVNDDSEALAEAIEKYIKKIMEEHKIEDQYKVTIEAYRRFAGFKECIQFFRYTELQDKEPLCSICLTETVTFVLTPCGHTFCGTCMKRQSTNCYMCRSSIKDRIKIYFG